MALPTAMCEGLEEDHEQAPQHQQPLKNGNEKQQQPQQVWFRMQFRTVCEICLAMPLVGLVACLIVALLFQFDHIQETACKVSISANIWPCSKQTADFRSIMWCRQLVL